MIICFGMISLKNESLVLSFFHRMNQEIWISIRKYTSRNFMHPKYFLKIETCNMTCLLNLWHKIKWTLEKFVYYQKKRILSIFLLWKPNCKIHWIVYPRQFKIYGRLNLKCVFSYAVMWSQFKKNLYYKDINLLQEIKRKEIKKMNLKIIHKL